MNPDRYAVLGNPVAHSRSPFIHAAFARQTGQDISYERLLCPLDNFEDSVRAFAAAGGRGCNITVPFKLQVPALAARVSPRAALAGAANLLRMDDDGWFADNTDGVGLLRDVEEGAAVAVAGKRVLLVGAGGAAAGVLGPLLQARPAVVVLANRTLSKAQALAASHAAWRARMAPRCAPAAWMRRAASTTSCSTPAPAACRAQPRPYRRAYSPRARSRSI